MGFKLPGKSIQSGTSGHRSALKMVTEQRAASALKAVEPTEDEIQANEDLIEWTHKEIAEGRSGLTEEEGGEKTTETKTDDTETKTKTDDTKTDDTKTETKKKKAPKLTKHGTKTYKTAYTEDTDKGKATREKYKTQKEFNKAADDWWASEAGQKKASAKGSKFAHRIIKKDKPVISETKVKPTKTEKVISKGEDKKTEIKTKAAKRTGEVTENVEKRVAGISKKDARKKYGKGSKEHLAAKLTHQKAKETDIQGGKGGRKRGLFRGLATKINIRNQKKTQAQIDALETSPAKHLGKASHPTGAIAAHKGHMSRKKTLKDIKPNIKRDIVPKKKKKD